MDENTKKTVLRMIPYGLYVLTTVNSDEELAAATVNWVTQASFNPPLIVVCVKADSHTHHLMKQSRTFVLNVLGKGHGPIAFAFFKPAVKEGQTLSGEPYRSGANGAPILNNALAYLECKLLDASEKGDHTVFVAQVVEAGIHQQPEGRPDEATLWLKDLGEKIFYGG